MKKSFEEVRFEVILLNQDVLTTSTGADEGVADEGPEI